MTEQEFVDLDFLSHVACEGATYDGKGFLILTLGLTAADHSAHEDQRMVRFVLDHSAAEQLSRGRSNGIRGIPTIA